MIFDARHKIIKIVAITACVCFLWQDVVWAAGSDFTVSRSHLRAKQFAESSQQPTFKASAAGDSMSQLPTEAASAGKAAKLYYRYRKHAGLAILGGVVTALTLLLHNDPSFFDAIIKPYSAWITLLGGTAGLLTFASLAVIGFMRARNEELVNNLLNAMKDDSNVRGRPDEYKEPSISGYYSYQRLDETTFHRRIRGFFGLSAQSELMGTLENRLKEADDDNKFYVLYHNGNAQAQPVIEAIVNIRIVDGIWYISFECINGNRTSRYLSEDFIREEIAKRNPSIVIFQKGCVDEHTLSTPLRNHIPMFHVAKRETVRDRALKAFGIDIQSEKAESDYLVYEYSKFTLLDKVTLWVAAQKFSRKYMVGVWHFTLASILTSIFGGLMWNKITDYAGSPEINVLSQYNFAMAYLPPLVVLLVNPYVGEWVARMVRDRLDRRTVDLEKDKDTGRIREKWRAKVADHRVVSTILRCMWLKPVIFPVYRFLYMALFPWAILGTAYGANLFPQIASPAVYLTMLFVWWFFINITAPIIGQTWGEAVVGEMQNSEAAKSKGFAAVYPAISSFSDFVWINIIQLSSFAIGHGIISLMTAGALSLNIFVPLVIGLTMATFANEFTLPLLAHDYNAYLEIDDCVAPMSITDARKGASRLTYVQDNNGPQVWLDVIPVDNEFTAISPIRLNNESYLPWLENTMQASIHSRNGFKVNAGKANRFVTSSVTFRASDNGPAFTLRKRWGKIIEGRDYITRMGQNGISEVIFYPDNSPAAEAAAIGTQARYAPDPEREQLPIKTEALRVLKPEGKIEFIDGDYETGKLGKIGGFVWSVTAGATGNTVDIWTKQLCDGIRLNPSIVEDPRLIGTISIISIEEERFEIIRRVCRQMHQENKITADVVEILAGQLRRYGVISNEHIETLMAMAKEFRDMEHLLDVVHDILNYFTPINGYILFGFNESSYTPQERQVFEKFFYLDNERGKWTNKKPTEIEFYRLRSSDPQNYVAIIKAGRNYLETMRESLLALRESDFMDRGRIEYLVKDAELDDNEPAKLAADIYDAFVHEIDYGENLLDSYLSADEAPEAINVVSEIEAITRIFAMENARASDHQVPKINFTVEIEGDEDAVRQACVSMKPTAFQDAVRNPLKNAVYNMPRQENAFIKVRISVVAGVVIIRILDNAGGIPIERNGVKIRENILKAYITTKETKQESAIKGRGLTITKQHVEGAGGSITLEDTVTIEELTADEISRRQQAGLIDYPGTIVRIELPVSASAAGVKSARDEAIRLSSQTAAALIVQGEEVRRMNKRMLVVDTSEDRADAIASELSVRYKHPLANIYTISLEPGESLETALVRKYGTVPEVDYVFSNVQTSGNGSLVFNMPVLADKLGVQYPDLKNVRKIARRIAEFV